jgi:hypothetical protein
MSLWFLWTMNIMNALAAGVLLAEKQYPLAVMYICYAIAGSAMTWLVK